MNSSECGPEVQAQEPITPAWLSTREATIYVGLSHVTLGKIRKAGKIKAARVGGTVRYERASLDAYMLSCVEVA